MSQDGVGVDLETSLGYLLKEASSALRAAMDEVLRPLGMSVTHYSCLELLAQRPGLSNSELARGAFVTRQSMNVLLQTLEREGHVTRPEAAPVGKVLPTRLTPRGRMEPREGDRGGAVRRGPDAGRDDRNRAVGRVPDPAEHDPVPARRRLARLSSSAMSRFSWSGNGKRRAPHRSAGPPWFPGLAAQNRPSTALSVDW